MISTLFMVSAVWACAGPVWPPVPDLSNGFVAVVPLVAWNALLWSKIRLDRFFTDDAPKPLLAGESVARAFTFAYPILLTIDRNSQWFQPGLGVYLVGTGIYFGSWLLLAYGNESTLRASKLLQLAPAYTPILAFAGIAAMTQSPLYLIGSAVFITLHVLEYALTFR